MSEVNQSTFPLVSVLMTAYNREQYLGEAIDSVLASSFTDFELIIVDDASTDQTYRIALGYAKTDARIQLYQNRQNLGDYLNRNKAASYAKGKYLKYVDSDDWILKTGLEELVDAMQQYPEAAIGFSSLGQGFTAVQVLTPHEAYRYHFFGPGLFIKGPLSAIMRRDVFNALGGFEATRMTSDIDLWHRVALHYPVILVPGEIVRQRKHAAQELADENKFIVAGEKIKWKYLLSPDCDFTSQELHRIKRKRIKKYILFILSGLVRFNFQQVQNYGRCLRFILALKPIHSKTTD